MKESKSVTSRIVLDKSSMKSVEEMIGKVKEEGQFVKINPSKLVSWIVSWFFKCKFEREKARIIQEHFNGKEYLKNILQDTKSNEDVERALKEALEAVAPKKRRRQREKRK